MLPRGQPIALPACSKLFGRGCVRNTTRREPKNGVTFDEAVECFFSAFQIRRNKKYRDRDQLLGRALGGRKLKIIFQLKSRNIVRIITEWPL